MTIENNRRKTEQQLLFFKNIQLTLCEITGIYTLFSSSIENKDLLFQKNSHMIEQDIRKDD